MVMLFDRYRPEIQRAAMRITTAGHTKVERSIARSELVSANGRHHWQLAASHHRALLDRRETALLALNPHSVMERGFALVARTHDGMPIRSIDHVRRGDSATVSLVDGEFLATVDATPSSLFHREDPSS
jgi:exonuclease VII large subunit